MTSKPVLRFPWVRPSTCWPSLGSVGQLTNRRPHRWPCPCLGHAVYRSAMIINDSLDFFSYIVNTNHESLLLIEQCTAVQCTTQFMTVTHGVARTRESIQEPHAAQTVCILLHPFAGSRTIIWNKNRLDCQLTSLDTTKEVHPLKPPKHRPSQEA